MSFKQTVFIFFIIASTSLSGSHANTKWKKTGDLLEFALPATAFTATYFLHDMKGTGECVKGLCATTGITYGLKYMINAQRPSGKDHSFPSGHTAFAFYGAGFIHQRYGLAYATPCYAAALCVAYSRVKIKDHWINDTVGGAAIGILCSILLTTHFQSKSHEIYPIINSDTIALCYTKQY